MHRFKEFTWEDLVVLENAIMGAMNRGGDDPESFPGRHMNRLRGFWREIHDELEARERGGMSL
jgi:hypothetical protein